MNREIDLLKYITFETALCNMMGDTRGGGGIRGPGGNCVSGIIFFSILFSLRYLMKMIKTL